MLKKLFLNEWIILVLIVINAILLFAMGFDEVGQPLHLVAVDYFFTVIFIVEQLVKIRHYGWKEYIRADWNKIDFIIIAISSTSFLEVFNFPDVSFLLLFRMIRVLRIFRFIRFIPDIDHLARGIKRSMKASIFIFVALFVYNFLLSILTCYIFKEIDPLHFGDPLISFYSIFTIFTIEGWNLIPEHIATLTTPIMGMLSRFYFIGVVLTGGIFGFSIVNAIFVDEMVMDNTDTIEAKIDDLNAKVDRLVESAALKAENSSEGADASGGKGVENEKDE